MAKSPLQSRSLLQLRYSAFFEVTVSPTFTADDTETEQDWPDIQHGLTVKAPEDESGNWRVILNIKIGAQVGKSYPYRGEFGIIGVFAVNEEFSASRESQEIKKIVGVNGASILYGIVREYFSIISSRSLNGAVPPLDTLDFRHYAPQYDNPDPGTEATQNAVEKFERDSGNA